MLRTPLGDLLPWLTRSNPLLESVGLSALSFEALLFTIAIAFILLAMAKERAEYRHKTAAMIDSLTGISNRRAFLQAGEQHFKRQVNNPRPTAVMLLDLDNFKSINDRYGHAIGDQILETFAKVSSSCLRRIDLFARLGGEEFAALLHDTARDRALAVAEQIRSAFAAATREVEGLPVAGTVSIGIVVAHDGVLDLSALLVQADHALYRAKHAGRNRIEVASIELILDRTKRGVPDVNRGPSGRSNAKSAA
jgi:diguanylate cyclase (GGDEF)-like protein